MSIATNKLLSLMEEGIMEFTIETLSEREEDIQSTTDETVARY